jgi:D-glycero-D-manno-heptose 1,7-bisphosphate phosphatase
VTGARATFVDRDGVVDALVPDPATGEPESPLQPDDVALLPGAASALRALSEAGWVIVGVSNQPAAAKGTVTAERLGEVHARVLALLATEGAGFDAFKLCLHHPDGIVPELTGECDCRKPAPGMLLSAARELGIDLERSWMIGDTDSDVLAGQAAGCKTVLVEHPPSAHKRNGLARADAVVPDLTGAVTVVLDFDRVN